MPDATTDRRPLAEADPAARAAVHGAVRRVLAPTRAGGLVLAVSGGRDSMALLHAVHAAGLADRVAVVATFDHRSGPGAARAAALVRQVAERLGMRVAYGAADAPMPTATERHWRDARWRFLHAIAERHAARVVTAHTQDDQVETVAFRAWRGAGPRGLAGLDADDGPLRPLLAVPRRTVAVYAAAHRLPVVDDPSNEDRRHARVRWRLDLLPAIERARPGFREGLLQLAARAAAWRRDVEGLVREVVTAEAGPVGVLLRAPALADVPSAALAWVWPAILAPWGVIPDRRALTRLAGGMAPGRRVALPHGAELAAVATGQWVLTPGPALRPRLASQPLDGVVPFGRWTLRPASPASPASAVAGPARGRSRGGGVGQGDASPWHGRLPADIHLEVRAWRPGDRLAGPAGPRRVARWLAEAGIPAPLREGWPVVAVGANVWWIPGVCQAELPPDQPQLTYVCDR